MSLAPSHIILRIAREFFAALFECRLAMLSLFIEHFFKNLREAWSLRVVGPDAPADDVQRFLPLHGQIPVIRYLKLGPPLPRD